jgi:fluoroquinolone transport system permease protein
MKRLWTAVQGDIRLQFRNGFYYAAAFIMVVMVILLRQLPGDSLAWLLPLFIVGNLLTNSFYFVSGLVLLEKDEGTLAVLVVTPLRSGEYLAAKVATLTLLSLAENGLIVLLVYGFSFRLDLFLLALLGATAVLTLTGFIVVVGYDSINQFLMPSVLYTSILLLPLLVPLVLPDHWLFYLHPVYAPHSLMQAAFSPTGVGHIIVGFLISMGWTAVLFYAAQNAFYRFVIAGSRQYSDS